MSTDTYTFRMPDAPPGSRSGGKRCAIRPSAYLDDWYVGYSPRNGEGASVEGSWADWQALAENILGVRVDQIRALLAEVERLRRDLAAIRAALGNGADEAAWPPGLTVAEAVARLRVPATVEECLSIARAALSRVPVQQDGSVYRVVRFSAPFVRPELVLDEDDGA